MSDRLRKPSSTLGSFALSRLVPFAGIGLLALALRVIQLNLQPLWWDEGYSVFFATRDWAALIERTAVDIHPPLYYVLLQLWMDVLGKGPVALRLLSVAIGLAALPFMYLLTWRLFRDTPLALLATLLLALSPLHIYYSQEVRMYGLLMLLGMASTVLFLGLVAAHPKGRGLRRRLVWAGYVLLSAAALYTEYYAAFILLFQVVAVLVLGRVKRPDPDTGPIVSRSATVVSAWAAIAALYLLWAAYAGSKLYAYVTGKVSHESYSILDPFSYLAQHLSAFSVGHLSQFVLLSWASTPVILLAVVGLVAQRQYATIGRRAASLVALYLLVPLLLGYLVNLVYPFHPVRYERLLLLSLPAFVLLVALGIRFLWERHMLAGGAAFVIVSLVSLLSLYDFYTVDRYPKDDYRQLIGEIQARSQSRDAVLAFYPWQIGYLESYSTGAPMTVLEVPNDLWASHPERMSSELGDIMAAHGRVWMPEFQMLGRIVEDRASAFLRSRHYSVVDGWYGTTRLELYALGDSLASAGRPPIHYAGGLILSDWGSSANLIASGQDPILVWLKWNEGGGSKMSLRLQDPNGNIWAQDDRSIETGTQRIGLIVPAGVPPGSYQLRLVVYKEEAVQEAQSDGNGAERVIALGQVQLASPPRPELARLPHAAAVQVADSIRLVGMDFAGPSLRPGEPATIALLWQATGAPQVDYSIALAVRDADGNQVASTVAPPAHGIYPTVRWQPNELVRDPQTITLRGSTADGDYGLYAAVVPANTAAAPGTSQRWLKIGTLAVKGRPHYFGAPRPTLAFDARFGDVARLIGYDVVTTPGEVKLVLYWQALSTPQVSYTVFAHVVDRQGTTRGQGDQIPGAGAFPTTSWLKGEYLVDEYTIPLQNGLPPDAQIRVGLYDAATGSRLPASDASGQAIGDNVLLPLSALAGP